MSFRSHQVPIAARVAPVLGIDIASTLLNGRFGFVTVTPATMRKLGKVQFAALYGISLP
ncbi:hypothetical protein [Octadecabacter ascidiaceicola]|uniref:hypothetical protein n=1 Tax=Octadecabacter ascidiaceicola TaxID=1655543 RepID=UPI0015C58EE3|nr:hypothetical protein [Octadecabacter ascidiaceicola]